MIPVRAREPRFSSRPRASPKERAICSCDWNWVCSKCSGTPRDWRDFYFFGEDSGQERKEDESREASRVDWRENEVAA